MPPNHDRIRAFFDEQIPFNRLLGLTVDELGDGFARVAVPYAPELVGDPERPALHGGVLSATIDAAAFTQVNGPGDRISTIDLRVDYLRPAELRDILAEARVMRMGNRVASVDVLVFHKGHPDTPIASGKAVYSIKRAK